MSSGVFGSELRLYFHPHSETVINTRSPACGQGTRGEPAQHWDAAAAAAAETRQRRGGGGTHEEAWTHTVQEAFRERVELRLPHRAAVLGSSVRTEDAGVRRCRGEQFSTGWCRAVQHETGRDRRKSDRVGSRKK